MGGKGPGEEQHEPDPAAIPSGRTPSSPITSPAAPAPLRTPSGTSQDRGTPTSAMLPRTNLADRRSAAATHALAAIVTMAMTR